MTVAIENGFNLTPRVITKYNRLTPEELNLNVKWELESITACFNRYGLNEFTKASFEWRH